MSKHTPGEWEVFGGSIWQRDGTEQQSNSLILEMQKLFGAWPGKFIAFTDPRIMVQAVQDDPEVWLEDTVSDDERQANAILMAEAPALLKAAEQLLEAPTSLSDSSRRMLQIALRHACHKARGQS